MFLNLHKKECVNMHEKLHHSLFTKKQKPSFQTHFPYAKTLNLMKSKPSPTKKQTCINNMNFTQTFKQKHSQQHNFINPDQPISKMNQKRPAISSKLPLMASLLLITIFIIFNLYPKSPFSHSSNLQKDQNHPSTNQFSLMIGILTRADNYDRRHFLRLIYGIQSTPFAQIDIKFVFCNLTKQEQRVLISLEILRFNDIVILNCFENMNSGKTYTYFSSLPSILSQSYDYVMKADDDVFLRLSELAFSLQPLPRSDMYYGFVIPCQSMDPFVSYMSGMGFVLSWDLVEWIASSGIPRNDTVGPEDKLVGRWLDAGGKARNRFSNKPAMYDYPGTNGRCSHELVPDTIAVHRLKRWEQWLAVIRFFNVTKGLKSSKLYHGLDF